MAALEEAAFLNNILADLDNTFLNAASSPDASSTKQRQLATPTKNRHHPPTHIASSPVLNEDDLAFLAQNWDWGAIEADLVSPVKRSRMASNSVSSSTEQKYSQNPYEPEICTRCIVESIVIPSHFQKDVMVKVDPTDERRRIILKDDWATLDIRPGDTFNVLGPFATHSPSSSTTALPVTISSKSNYLILHPDILLTATTLSNALHCRRKPLLGNLIRNGSDFTPALIWGNMLHEVMQACLTAGRWEESWIDAKIDEAIQNSLMELVKVNIGIEQAKREVLARSKGLRSFAQRYIAVQPKAEGVLINTRSKGNHNSLLAISQFHDVEEDIWSPRYGLKGKIDATVQAVVTEPTLGVFTKTTATPMPFEIKTGRTIAGMEHRAQTMLYTLLIAERYGVDVPSGLLYYTQNEEVISVPASRNELRGLFMARNEIAGHMMRRTQIKLKRGKEGEVDMEDLATANSCLPPTINDEWLCKRCNVLDTCMLYRKAVENVIDTSSPIADTYQLKTGHLTTSQSAFFKQWEFLLTLEEQDLVRFKKELWTMGAVEREAKGRCFSLMVLDTSYCPPPTQTSNSLTRRMHKFTYKFVRQPTATPSRLGTSLLSGHMSCGDAITVSVEPNLLAFAKGFILELTPTEVTVGIDHELRPDTIKQRLCLRNCTEEVIFRIDKDELFAGMSRIRGNLANLFYAEGDTRRLSLVVDLQSPRFIPMDSVPPSWHAVVSRAASILKLNANQVQAVWKVLTAEDYAMILGMPGTGKTTVIAAVISILVQLGKTVLLTSYTHSAVDNILVKMGCVNFGILRVGNVDKIHPEVLRYTLSARPKATTIEEIEEQLMSPPVVATTCLSLENALFTRRTFDYCIVDEASQITLPTCLGPLRYADKFILVGDHFQLPPLVRSKDSRTGGLEVSLFRRLSDAHPQAVVDLVYQYRMNRDIMLLSNELIYNNRLVCGSKEVAARSLVLPNPRYLNMLHQLQSRSACSGSTCWLETLMLESCKAVFVDTDNVPAIDSRVGDLVQNEIEAMLVYQVTETLLRSGVQEHEIGIISVYRQQIKLLSNLLVARRNLEILTADRSQGRDKECIIISLVRSNDDGQIGDLVKDWRRMNVSFTRARSKLIIFGSRKTLQTSPLLSDFFSLMDAQGWLMKLPAGADKIHPLLMQVSNSTVVKRPLCEEVHSASQKENKVADMINNGQPQKKAKVVKSRAETGLLRNRPILQDLVRANA